MNVEAMLKDLGIERYRLVADKNWVFPCVYPAHRDRNPSFSLHAKHPYVYQCWGCGEKGNIVKMIMVIKKVDPLEAIKYLERFGYTDVADFSDPVAEPAEDPELKVPLSAFKPFKEWRGITEETIKHWELCYDEYLGRVLFPVRDISSRLVGLVGRTTIGSKVKYYFYDDFKKGRHVYGLHACDPNKPIVVVEGNFDAVKMWHLGCKNVCATMGATITDKQMELIKNKAKTVYLALDNDFAGALATRRMVMALQKAVTLYVLTYPVGMKDAGEFKTPEQVQTLLDGKMPIL